MTFLELVDSLVKAIADSMLGSKENIDADCQNYLRTRNMVIFFVERLPQYYYWQEM